MRIAAYLFLLLVLVCYLIQFVSVYMSGEFVSILAIDNANHISLLLNRSSLLAAAATTLLFVFTIWILEVFFRSQVSTKGLVAYFCLLLAGGLAVDNHALWVSDNLTKLRDDFYKERSIRIAHISPIESLFRAVFRKKNLDAVPFNLTDAEKAKKLGISIQVNQRFPLLRDQIFTNPIPFQTRPNSILKPNVIVFFTEGLSARITNTYGGIEPGLTPNITEFSKHGMVVDNYYNHTFATYRGLHGQICSIYPFHGGLGGWHTDYQSVKKVDYFCLSEIFNNAGYETIFLDTHRADSGYIDEMMKEIKFANVINAEEVRDEYIFQEPLRKDALSDNQLIDGLIAMLREREQEQAEERQPFFLATYNLETHAWQKIAKNGKRYPNKDNYILDSVHNFDHAFGRFWQYLQQSSYSDNTIVILTSDHAHYPDRDFVKLMKQDADYRPYFVDQIPLIIYDPGKRLPKKFNANYSSSIDFAPTVAHLMNFNSQNAFLGTSLFDSTPESKSISFAAAGEEYFLIDPRGVQKSDDPDSDQNEMDFLKRLIHTIHQLERHDRIVPPIN